MSLQYIAKYTDLINHYLEVPFLSSLSQNKFVIHRDEIRDISPVDQMAIYATFNKMQNVRTFCDNYSHKENGRNTTELDSLSALEKYFVKLRGKSVFCDDYRYDYIHISDKK